MNLQKPYSDWVIKKEFPFNDTHNIGGGLDSSIYLDENGLFGKLYDPTFHPWEIVDYHRIHATLDAKGPFECKTSVGNLVISVLNLGLVYREPNGRFFSLPPYVSGNKSLTRMQEEVSIQQVRRVLGVDKRGTHHFLSYNSKITKEERNVKHITVTDLGGTIPSFVEANRHLIDATIIPSSV